MGADPEHICRSCSLLHTQTKSNRMVLHLHLLSLEPHAQHKPHPPDRPHMESHAHKRGLCTVLATGGGSLHAAIDRQESVASC